MPTTAIAGPLATTRSAGSLSAGSSSDILVVRHGANRVRVQAPDAALRIGIAAPAIPGGPLAAGEYVEVAAGEWFDLAFHSGDRGMYSLTPGAVPAFRFFVETLGSSFVHVAVMKADAAQLGPAGTASAAAAGVPWLPMFATVAIGDFATLDNYITGVTDHGGGEMTLTLDKTMQRTAVGNGDLLYLDLGQHIQAAGSQTHVLEARITTITRPADVTGAPYVAFCHNVGINSRSATGPVLSLFYGSTDSARLTTLLSSVTSTAAGLGTVGSWLLRYAHATAVAVNQYGVTADAIGGTAASARWSIMSTVAPPDAANIEVGYNQAGGQSHALAFSQLAAQPAGSDTLRIRCEYRVVPFWLGA